MTGDLENSLFTTNRCLLKPKILKSRTFLSLSIFLSGHPNNTSVVYFYCLYINIIPEGFQSLKQHVVYHGLILNKIHDAKQNTPKMFT